MNNAKWIVRRKKTAKTGSMKNGTCESVISANRCPKMSIGEVVCFSDSLMVIDEFCQK